MIIYRVLTSIVDGIFFYLNLIRREWLISLIIANLQHKNEMLVCGIIYGLLEHHAGQQSYACCTCIAWKESKKGDWLVITGKLPMLANEIAGTVKFAQIASISQVCF